MHSINFILFCFSSNAVQTKLFHFNSMYSPDTNALNFWWVAICCCTLLHLLCTSAFMSTRHNYAILHLLFMNKNKKKTKKNSFTLRHRLILLTQNLVYITHYVCVCVDNIVGHLYNRDSDVLIGCFYLYNAKNSIILKEAYNGIGTNKQLKLFVICPKAISVPSWPHELLFMPPVSASIQQAQQALIYGCIQ